jgi:hypothetical protein
MESHLRCGEFGWIGPTPEHGGAPPVEPIGIKMKDGQPIYHSIQGAGDKARNLWA